MTLSSPLREPEHASGVYDMYEARRSATGWSTVRRLTPSGAEAAIPVPGGVSADHSYAFLNVQALGPPLPGGSLAEAETADFLSRPDGSFEFTASGSLASEPYGQGRYISAGGGHIIFSTGKDIGQSIWCQKPGSGCKVLRLEPNSPPEGTGAVYDREGSGETRMISLLPDDLTPISGQEAFYEGVSEDGSTVAFTIEGTLYVRVPDAEDGHTLKVTDGAHRFAGISAEGDYLFYVIGGDSGTIHRFDTATKADVEVNPTAAGEIVNVSGDGSHVYFISESQIGGEGIAGEPNLYVWSGVAPGYVTTVAPSDLEQTSGALSVQLPALTRWTSGVTNPPSSGGEQGPGADSSRSTPDGTVLVFESRAKLTSYENDGYTEVYRYDDLDKSLTCVSCNLSVAAATGDARLQELRLVPPPTIIHNVSDDGGRVFFETDEALVKRDTDEVNDVYEWRQEDDDSKPDLISSGFSTEYPTLPGSGSSLVSPNLLLSITPSGDDVAFLSQDALVPEAGLGGAPAIYDARVGGGFPRPPASQLCFELGCHADTSAPPPLPSPTSNTTSGEGNVKPRKRHRKHRCRSKGKHGNHRKHQRCRGKRSPGAHGSATDPTQANAPVPTAQAVTPGLGGSGQSAEPQAALAAAAGEFDDFGIEQVGASLTTGAAGARPDFTTLIALNHFINKNGEAQADARAENVTVSLPPGLLGNPNAVPRCKTGQLIARGNCPLDSQVGIAKVLVYSLTDPHTEPVFNMEVPHPDREVARLGFFGVLYPVFISIKVRTAGDYGVTATVEDGPGLAPLVEAETTLWGNPADSSHDSQRMTADEALVCEKTACKAGPDEKRESGILSADRKPFLTNPSACQEGAVAFTATSYQLPGQVFTASAPLTPITDCVGLPFSPSFEAHPTNGTAGGPTGLTTVLRLPQSEDPGSRGAATMREARVTLPEGMGINPAAADGLAACSDQQVGFHEEVDAQCPDASKLGTVRILSPSLPGPIEGFLFQRTQQPGHPFGLWLVVDALGLHVKLPGELEADRDTGRLTAVFRDLPQVPVEEIDLEVWGGPRAPLQNPDGCGTHTTRYTFAPHSNDPPVTGTSEMTIDAGCDAGFSPRLRAGSTKAVAGAFSPFILDLTREDGEQEMRGFEVTLPDGELAKLAGVPLCPEPSASSGACPAASRIGEVAVAGGAGPTPLWLPQPGKSPTAIYLAGPFAGAPFSIVTAVPAQAGPFDLGTVAVRSALAVDSETARVTVKTDPLPRFVEGVPVTYRHLHAMVDRPAFALNPTDCRELATSSTITSITGAIAHPSDRFQVNGCRDLGFKPKLSLKLRGGSKRGGYPALTAMLRARKGDANIGRVSVALPRSEFLAQSHIGTICTRPQFAADKCPKGSEYGSAKAWTPLLDKPLAGPVYLRSNGGDRELPDLVVALDGELDIDLVGYIDSVRGGLRTRFQSVPDAAVSKFVLKMKGGAKGLLENSVDICRRKKRAEVAFRAQNGRVANLRPPILTSCSKHN